MQQQDTLDTLLALQVNFKMVLSLSLDRRERKTTTCVMKKYEQICLRNMRPLRDGHDFWGWIREASLGA